MLQQRSILVFLIILNYENPLSHAAQLKGSVKLLSKQSHIVIANYITCFRSNKDLLSSLVSKHCDSITKNYLLRLEKWQMYLILSVIYYRPQQMS